MTDAIAVVVPVAPSMMAPRMSLSEASSASKTTTNLPVRTLNAASGLRSSMRVATTLALCRVDAPVGDTRPQLMTQSGVPAAGSSSSQQAIHGKPEPDLGSGATDGSNVL